MDSSKFYTCDNCGISINYEMRYHREFDVLRTGYSSDNLNEMGSEENKNSSTPSPKQKETVYVTGCSTKCLLQWYENQEKVQFKELPNSRFRGSFGGGTF